MQFASQLKFRYIWVGALCIAQDPPGTDVDQVQAMDAIYHYSQMTIVVAFGSDTKAGLPVLGSHPRPEAIQSNTRQTSEADREWSTESEREEVQTEFWYYHPRLRLEHSMMDMQEQLLSQRCLFVTERHILPMPLLDSRRRVWSQLRARPSCRWACPHQLSLRT